jgi:hypothetical protein
MHYSTDPFYLIKQLKQRKSEDKKFGQKFKLSSRKQTRIVKQTIEYFTIPRVGKGFINFLIVGHTKQ